jgi:hypothetical protein
VNQLQAFRDTVALAKRRGLAVTRKPELSLEHVQDMLRKVESDPEAFSPSKLGRWLGWAQAAVVSWGNCSLEDMKQINVRNRDD